MKKKSSDIAVDQAGGDTGGGGRIPPTGGWVSTGVVKGNCPIREPINYVALTVVSGEMPNCIQDQLVVKADADLMPFSMEQELYQLGLALWLSKVYPEESVDSQQEEGAAQGGASMDACCVDAPDSQAHRGIDKGDWTPNVKPSDCNGLNIKE